MDQMLSLERLLHSLQTLEQDAITYIQQSTQDKGLLRHTLLGPKSEFAKLSKLIGTLPKEERATAGQLLNKTKRAIEHAIDAKQEEKEDNLSTIDITMPGHRPAIGHYHPTTIVIHEMNEIFKYMGFSVYDGPEIETDEYNYDRVNLPPDHPARDLQDTLYLKDSPYILRTHTSSVEAHILQDFTPPYRFVIPGKVYRYENVNASNNIMFYQYQGLAVGTGITMAHLKGTLDTFIKKFFGNDRETRFRCKYYPEVEPGVGVDISCAFCKKNGCAVCKGRGWIEMLGAGMIHPNMLRRVGHDPSVISGFAWGMGLDRIVMQRYGINDIRSLYNGDIMYKE